MKKILIANDLLKGGGVENVLENLVRYLEAQGNEITLMIPGCSEKEIQDFFGKNVKVFSAMRERKALRKFTLPWVWDRGLFVLEKQLFCLKFFLKQYDVAIALKEGPTMQTLSQLYAKKKYAWVHTDYNYMHWTRWGFHSLEQERECMMRFDQVACVSQAALVSVIQTIGDPGNLCVKYNPINWHQIREKAREPLADTKHTEGILFVSVGRLAYPKNYSLLIDVCNELSKTYTFELWIIGDGPDYEDLQKKINAYELTCVKLLGSKDNPFPYLQQADAFISASLVESYGLAIQEALILGKPVIAVKCPAIAENFKKGYGLLPEGTHQSVKDAMESVLANPKRLEEYGENIAKQYQLETLFESRLAEIEKMWEAANEK